MLLIWMILKLKKAVTTPEVAPSGHPSSSLSDRLQQLTLAVFLISATWGFTVQYLNAH